MLDLFNQKLALSFICAIHFVLKSLLTVLFTHSFIYGPFTFSYRAYVECHLPLFRCCTAEVHGINLSLNAEPYYACGAVYRILQVHTTARSVRNGVRLSLGGNPPHELNQGRSYITITKAGK